jgi:hypothetical protein
MRSAAARLKSASPTKSVRQPNGPSSASTGAVAESVPMLPIAIIQPESAVSRSRGNQSVNALIEPMRPAETPRPMSARPAESIARSRASPKVSAPVAATHMSAAAQRRGPKRSSSTPEETADLVRQGRMPTSVGNVVSKIASTALKLAEVKLAARLAEFERQLEDLKR